ncbi:Fanconi anemia group E protein isoform X2 [Sceloporus undulatus]|nr:Fanconi anemia group E protein isoform X2 [Sceloporus undulatus]XP_042317751.1 Fanconi anemia group E protein isoform X2 [Sceloporus undulatus]
MDKPSLPWLQRCDKTSRLLLCTLMSGPCGALAAFRSLQRSQSTEEGRQGFNWQIFTEYLCSQEPVLKGPEQTLILKPLLLLLPVLCQRNLFSLLLTVESAVPKDCLNRLLQASRLDSSPDLWVQRMRDLLQMGLEEKSASTPGLLSSVCEQQLKDLCQKVMAHHSKPISQRKLSWFVKQTDPCLEPCGDALVSGSQMRKNKKALEETLTPEEERQRKRLRLDAEGDRDFLKSYTVLQGVGVPSTGNELMMEVSGSDDVHSLSDNVCQTAPKENAIETGGENQNPSQDAAAKVPDHIKVHVPKLKEQLQLQFDHLGGTPPPELQILNECTPSQLEGLCSLLQLSECLENELLQFCTWLVALSPDLSYSNAAVLVAKLFLPRILLLTDPASWALITALMMFCSKYARPVCCTLISSIVQAPEKGHEQIKVVCKLIEECLEPEYVRLVFSHIIEVPWSEDLLTIVHSLLGRQVELSTEFFNVLVLNLCQMAQEFATSMHYAKLILTVLTKYQKSITLAQHHRLSCALDLNKTMLKKSLQVALKRVTSG